MRSLATSSKDGCAVWMDWASWADRIASGEPGNRLYSQLNSAIEPSPNLQVKPTTKFVCVRAMFGREVISPPNGKSIGGVFDFPSASIQFPRQAVKTVNLVALQASERDVNDKEWHPFKPVKYGMTGRSENSAVLNALG